MRGKGATGGGKPRTLHPGFDGQSELVLHFVPQVVDILCGSADVADGDAQGEFAEQAGVGEEKVPVVVDLLHDAFVDGFETRFVVETMGLEDAAFFR